MIQWQQRYQCLFLMKMHYDTFCNNAEWIILEAHTHTHTHTHMG